MGPATQIVRVVAAAMLVVGFHLLALGAVAFFAFAAHYAWRRTGAFQAFAVMAVVFVILKALFPPRVTTRLPGPVLIEARQPRLFALIRDVARQTGQPMPAGVYLVAPVNAGVTRTGGILGVGGRDTLVIGLPLLEALSVGQIRSVLAHEFGHFHRGDAAFGPWIYATRQAIERVAIVLQGGFLGLPFVLYWRLFMRITQAISRAQERAADELAARIAGPRQSVEGLRRLNGATLAFESYWAGEMAPALEAGFLPPIAAGFRRFMANEDVARTVANTTAEEMKTTTSPYDSHPSLRERIARFKRLPPDPPAKVDPPAIELIDDVKDLERRLLGTIFGEADVRRLRPIDWEDVGRNVHVPRWRALASRKGRALAGATVSSVAVLAAGLDSEGGFLGAVDPDTPPADRRATAEWMLGASLAAALDAEGWTVRTVPGIPIRAEKDGETIEPFAVVGEIAAGRLPAGDWAASCERRGLADVPLVPPAADAGRSRPVPEPIALEPVADPGSTLLAANAVPAALTLAIGLATFVSASRPEPPVDHPSEARRGCDAGDPSACFHLGVHYMEADGVAPDPEVQLALFQKACEGGIPEGCYNAGNAHNDCRDRPRDDTIALRYFDNGCARGDRESCQAAVQMRAEPKPKPVDSYEDACGAGVAARCTDMGTLNQCGLAGLARDTAQAEAFYRQGCQGGDTIGCGFLKSYGYAAP